MAIAKLQTGLDNKDVVIANLENKLIGAVAELKDRDIAIANLKSELEARGEVKQLNFFPPEPTPTPTLEPVTEPETIPTPNPTRELKTKTKAKTKTKPKAAKKPQPEVLLLDSIDGTVAVGGLMEHLLDRKKQDPNFPDPPEKTQTFTDAVTGQTQRLSELENLYGFNLAGYVMRGQKREYRYTIN
jgi:outer membrane biosynthesis protein TonB